jgi:two-component system, OmpR family, sensor kinase
MTLRLRLILSVVAIVAAGLVISDVVTYNALRSFLITRVDQQLQAASFPVSGALLSSSGLGPKLPGAPPPNAASSHSSTGTRAPRFGGFARSGRHTGDIFRNGGGQSFTSGRNVLVPPGTYGQIRNARGNVEGHLFFSYGGKAPAAPAVPARLPGSGLSSSSDLYFSASTSGPGGVAYRAVAKPLIDGEGTIIIAVPLTDLTSTLRQLLLIEVIVSAVLLAGLGVLSWVMVRRDLRPLEAITETTGAIAGGELSSRVSEVSGGAEVAQLGRAFNTMLDQIERAFAQRAASEERLRRFLADASHELRTPLTSILGYADLFDLGVRDRPAELAASMHHISEEATRMGTLVDDLFLLAQLDHERPLHVEPMDLTALVQRSVASLSVAEPERPVIVRTSDPVWVDGDLSRLRQVVDNLVVNAQRHTPTGSPIEVRVRRQGDTAVLSVHDHGPGIDPEDAHRVFEPFFRSDPSRSRNSGGAGLGLAIVAAIVTAHRGTVRVEPGPGATFIVRLPAASAPAVTTDSEGEDGATRTAAATGPGHPPNSSVDKGSPGATGSADAASGDEAGVPSSTGPSVPGSGRR